MVDHNHNGQMDMAFKLISEARRCGADIAKFQLFDVKKILPPDHQWYWDLARSQISKDQWLRMVEKCNEVGIEFLASVFDVERVAWCEEVGMKRYKIASRSIYDQELLEAVAETHKPLIISLGMTDNRGIPKINNGAPVDYLYCVAKYPTLSEEVHLGNVDFKNTYGGFSDHTVGIEAALVAIARGARIIEKHFTLDKTLDGCDHLGSMTPEELFRLVQYSRIFEKVLA